MTRDFSEWLKTFRSSINSYGYYTDFQKVYNNVEQYKFELHLFNALLGSKHIEDDFKKLIEKYPACLKIIPLLLAVRSQEIFCQNQTHAKVFSFDQPEQIIEEYQYFMKETGLCDLLQNHLVGNVYDYATGVEVGLDSNARKNRGGHQMEDLVEAFLQSSGVTYYKEMNLSEIENRWQIDMSNISANGITEKRFDFVVKTENCVYGIETNFYASSGSKLNETARSYKKIAEESETIKNFQFVWITDGLGWKEARRNLEETFQAMRHLYNICDLENNLFQKIFL